MRDMTACEVVFAYRTVMVADSKCQSDEMHLRFISGLTRHSICIDIQSPSPLSGVLKSIMPGNPTKFDS